MLSPEMLRQIKKMMSMGTPREEAIASTLRGDRGEADMMMGEPDEDMPVGDEIALRNDRKGSEAQKAMILASGDYQEFQDEKPTMATAIGPQEYANLKSLYQGQDGGLILSDEDAGLAEAISPSESVAEAGERRQTMGDNKVPFSNTMMKAFERGMEKGVSRAQDLRRLREGGAPYKGSATGMHAEKPLKNFEDRWGISVEEL